MHHHTTLESWAADAEPHLLCMSKTSEYANDANDRLKVYIFIQLTPSRTSMTGKNQSMRIHRLTLNSAFRYKIERKKIPVAKPKGPGLMFVSSC
jgi:hypothetical protein